MKILVLEDIEYPQNRELCEGCCEVLLQERFVTLLCSRHAVVGELLEVCQALLDFYERDIPDEIDNMGAALELIREAAAEKEALHAHAHAIIAKAEPKP